MKEAPCDDEATVLSLPPSFVHFASFFFARSRALSFAASRSISPRKSPSYKFRTVRVRF